MFKMKFPVLVLIISLSFLKANGQIIKLRAIEASLIIRNDDPIVRKATFLATMDLDKGRIHLYTNTEQEYDLVKQLKKWQENGIDHAQYKALNMDGEEYLLEIVIFTQTVNIGVCKNDICYIYKFDLND